MKSTSAAAITGLQHTPWEGALDGAVTAHNMRFVFVGSGLFEWLGMSFLAESGDLYLSEANYVAMCQSQYPDVLSEFSWGDNGAYDTPRPDVTGYYQVMYRAHWLSRSPAWGKYEYDDDDGGAGNDLDQLDIIEVTIVRC